ncbi:HNH/endonuclease VII fold toxin-2 domain-containing protein [Methylotuvimicrobium alcaliphilum]|uniref:Tox-GHH2 domain-containing protein n=1 Tax=Methylotuvimicrobium alcaliphilum (strain DSM 19304 / NCIMB 14124 / VKM B-2133 / 20Z) TaxID=1091494 RepID=G4T2Y2_META2|nr:HNH/endonuclease VII fold toxin-2 domain-containing protein [Methylotuvimicrobium alcaliphilum]CCE23635.1 conserved protein of unknown function [Methylotuvimicrobium alcaliphilum 20Z]
MANEVYANGMELACKAGSGKTIASFPDVCFTPPENPATPPGVPIPYPNTGFASDTTKGSKNVKITGKEVMLKNKSYFKKSTGDEAGSAAKKGVISSTNRGKVYFIKWSMNVKFEGENVDRHLDLTTDNHASPMANEAVPWIFSDRMAMGNIGECADEKNNVESKCGDLNKPVKCPTSGYELVEARKKNSGKSKAEKQALERKLGGEMQRDPCQKALRCFLSPYEPNKCCPGQTPDHLIDVKSFVEAGQDRTTGKRKPGWDKYNDKDAPSMCVEGGAATCSTHGVLSTKRKAFVNQMGGKGAETDLETLAIVGAVTASDTFKGCSVECLEAQLLDYHRKVQDNNAKVSMSQFGLGESAPWKQGISARAAKLAKSWLG